MGGGTDDVGGPVCVCGWQQSLEEGRREVLGGRWGTFGAAVRENSDIAPNAVVQISSHG